MENLIKAIIDFQKNKEIKPKKEASTYKETLQLYQNGLTPDEIAIEHLTKHHYITYCKTIC
jgi:hypothetical protein